VFSGPTTAVQRLAATLFPTFILPEIIQKQFNPFSPEHWPVRCNRLLGLLLSNTPDAIDDTLTKRKILFIQFHCSLEFFSYDRLTDPMVFNNLDYIHMH
jgi:hypothetical protein